jgi:hypothetical protein
VSIGVSPPGLFWSYSVPFHIIINSIYLIDLLIFGLRFDHGVVQNRITGSIQFYPVYEKNMRKTGILYVDHIDVSKLLFCEDCNFT